MPFTFSDNNLKAWFIQNAAAFCDLAEDCRGNTGNKLKYYIGKI